MKRLLKLIASLISCVLFVSVASVKAEPKTVTVELTIDNVVYLIDGQPQAAMDTSFFVVDGRTMSSPRLFNEAFKIQMEGGWPKEVILKNKNTVIVMPYNNKTVKVNGKQVQTEVPVLVRMGRSVVPIRFIMETLGATVTWDPVLHKVTIVYEIPSS